MLRGEESILIGLDQCNIKERNNDHFKREKVMKKITQEDIDKAKVRFDGTCPFSKHATECSVMSVTNCNECAVVENIAVELNSMIDQFVLEDIEAVLSENDHIEDADKRSDFVQTLRIRIKEVVAKEIQKL